MLSNQALWPQGRNGLSSSDGRFCESRPFAHSDRFCRYKGRIAIVTDVGGGMRWTRCVAAEPGFVDEGMARTVKSCGPGIPVLMPSLQLMTSARATGAKEPVPGESAYKL